MAKPGTKASMQFAMIVSGVNLANELSVDGVSNAVSSIGQPLALQFAAVLGGVSYYDNQTLAITYSYRPGAGTGKITTRHN